MKIANVVRKGWNFSMWLWMLRVGCKKSLELKWVKKNEIPLKQMSFRLKLSYFERDGPVCTWSVHPVFAVILSTFAHMLYGSNDDIMQVSTISQFSCSAFQLQGHLTQNKSLNAWKIANEVREGWNLSMWLWMLHVGCKKILQLK